MQQPNNIMQNSDGIVALLRAQNAKVARKFKVALLVYIVMVVAAVGGVAFVVGHFIHKFW